MQTLTYEYQNKEIEFLLGGDMMINATEMASVYGKKVYDFTRRPETILFVEKLSKRAIGEFNDEDFTPFLSQFKHLKLEKVVKSVNSVPILITIQGREGATWMHRWLAIDFAMWLDLDFKIWLIEKIDYLLINYSNKQRELLNKKQALIKKRDQIIEENRDNPKIIMLNDINEELKKISQKMGQATKSQFSIWNNLNS